MEEVEQVTVRLLMLVKMEDMVEERVEDRVINVVHRKGIMRMLQVEVAQRLVEVGELIQIMDRLSMGRLVLLVKVVMVIRAVLEVVGGGWYGGGGGAYESGGRGSGGSSGGGGSGYVYTSSTASQYPSGCLLNSSYYLTNASTTGNSRSGNGYATITLVE